MERLDRGRKALQRAELGLHRHGERELERVEELQRRLAHHDHELRLDDVELAHEPRLRLVLVAARELEAVRPVDRHRVDPQPLQRLEDRLAGAAVERHALLHLRRLRYRLQHEDVGEGMPRSQHGHAAFTCGSGDLVPELVDLGDRLLQVLLGDVVGQGGAHGGKGGVLP